MTGAILAFLRHLTAFTMAGALIYELIGFRRDLSVVEARRLQRVDTACGSSAAMTARGPRRDGMS